MKKKIIVPLMAIALICVSVINYSTIQSGKESGVTLRSLVKISSAESEGAYYCTGCYKYVNDVCLECVKCYACCECTPEPCPNCYSTTGCDCANTDCGKCGNDLASCTCSDSYSFCDVCYEMEENCTCDELPCVIHGEVNCAFCEDGTTCTLCGGDPNASCPNCY